MLLLYNSYALFKVLSNFLMGVILLQTTGFHDSLYQLHNLLHKDEKSCAVHFTGSDF